MKNLILFDKNTLHYRQSIYKYFRNVFAEKGYNLVVVYDKKMNKIESDSDFFIGIDYSFRNCTDIIKKYDSRIIIQFILLKYKFLFPFMIWCRIKGIKLILWSHGINMQKRNQIIKNNLYYLRQILSTAQIIYTPNEKKYTVTSDKKIFVANNTLNYYDIPDIEKTKEELKEKYGYAGKRVVICVGRLNTHNRKVDLLFDAFELIKDERICLAVVGTGVTEAQQEKIHSNPRFSYFGPVFDPIKINEIYKMADIFVMPGGVGLAINHAFYHGLPTIIEDVNHSPEAYYLKQGENGFIFNKSDANDLARKILSLFENKEFYTKISENAKKTAIDGEASFDNMVKGFLQAIEYVEKI